MFVGLLFLKVWQAVEVQRISALGVAATGEEIAAFSGADDHGFSALGAVDSGLAGAGGLVADLSGRGVHRPDDERAVGLFEFWHRMGVLVLFEPAREVLLLLLGQGRPGQAAAALGIFRAAQPGPAFGPPEVKFRLAFGADHV